MQKVVVYTDTHGDAEVESAIDAMVEKGWNITTVEYRTITVAIVVYDTDEKGAA